MTKTTAPQPDSASRSLPDCRHCDTVSNSSSASCRPAMVLCQYYTNP